jgi:hypothetical protein
MLRNASFIWKRNIETPSQGFTKFVKKSKLDSEGLRSETPSFPLSMGDDLPQLAGASEDTTRITVAPSFAPKTSSPLPVQSLATENGIAALYPAPNYVDKSFIIFSKRNSFRKALISITDSALFDYFILLVILVNCVFLALNDPFDKNPNSSRNRMLHIADIVFVVIYTCEIVMRCIARGVWGAPDAYLAHPWNRMDVMIVVLGWIAMIWAVFRSLNVFRAIRAINTVKSMRSLISSVLKSLPLLADVAFLVLFFFMIYGVSGIQLFSGTLRGRCRPESRFNFTSTCSPIIRPNAQLTHNNTCYFVDPDDPNRICGLSSGGRGCPSGSSCVDVGNPNHGITSFDNFFWSFIAIFQSITREGWTTIMYGV